MSPAPEDSGVAQTFTKPQIIAHVEKSLDYTLYDAKWIPRSARFIVLGSRPRGTGTMQVYELSSGAGEVNRLSDVEKTNSFKCATFGASSLQQRRIATGDFKGNLHIWDIENLSKTPVYAQDNAHSEIINAIDGAGGLGQEGAPEIVTGGRDGAVRVWDTRQPEYPVARMEPVEGEARRDCWAVAFGDSHSAEDRTVAAGYDNGDLKLFDLRKMAVRWEKNVGNGICGLEFDRKDILMNKLVVTTLESKFYLFDLRTQHPTKGFDMLTEKAHKSTIWTVRHLPQNRDVFVTCGGSGSLNLWKYSYPSSRVKECSDGSKMGVVGTVQSVQNVIMSSQPIASFDWSPDKMGLAVCTAFDQTFRVIIVTKLNTL